MLQLTRCGKKAAAKENMEDTKMKILVTGGAGYIGSHTCVELLNAGYDVVVMDNLYNASEKAIERVEQITGKKVTFYKTDMLDREGVKKIFDNEKIDAVIHFAGLKAVGESVHKPIEYYHNNMTGTLILCDEMRNHGVKNIIFSSSATVYGNPAQIPITEECPKGTPTNPYGWTKSMLLCLLHLPSHSRNITTNRDLRSIERCNPKCISFNDEHIFLTSKQDLRCVKADNLSIPIHMYTCLIVKNAPASYSISEQLLFPIYACGALIMMYPKIYTIKKVLLK